MKKTLGIVTLGLAVLTSSLAYAKDSSVVFGGGSVGQDTAYGYLGAVTAINGNIDRNGFLARVSGGYGSYKYDSTTFTRNVDGNFGTADVMAGYQQILDMGHVAGYVGYTYEDHNLSPKDVGNEVRGGKSGAKAQVELDLNLDPHMVLKNVSNYSTPFDSYWTQTYVGWKCPKGKLSVGPEIAFLGNDEFDQQRYGIRVDDIKIIKKTQLYVSGGYLKAEGLGSNDGAYGSIGFSSKF